MRKLFTMILLCAAVQGTLAQASPDNGSEKIDWRDARITDVGVVVSQVERIIRTDSITGQRDTTYNVYPDEVVWQSDGTDVFDSLSVCNAAKARSRAKRAPTQGPTAQSGNLMSDYLSGFSYYVFSFDYPSIDADGKEIMLSAMCACPPKGKTVNNVVLGTHITITADRERPSTHFKNYDADDWGMLFSLAAGPKLILNGKYQAIVLAANIGSGLLNIVLPGIGALVQLGLTAVEIEQIKKAAGYHDYDYDLVIMPDYEGYGLTVERAHPYLYQELTARQCVDGMRYGKSLYSNDPALKYIRGSLRSDYRCFSCGYSQGGSVAMACHRFIEQNNLGSELHFVGSICGDGPYDPMATLMYYMQQEQAGNPMGMSVVLPLIVKGMLDTNPYMLCHTAEEYFRPEFLETGIMDWLASKKYSTTDIDNLWTNYAKDHPGAINYKSAHVSEIMNDECYAYFTKLYNDNKNTFTSAAGIPLPAHRGLIEDLHFALASNDMTSGWSPSKSIQLFHSKGDKVVPYVNAERAKNALGNKVNLETAKNGLDHGDSGVDFFKGDDLMDLGLKRWLNLRLYDYVSSICKENY